jgi:phosphate starvation-inducible PhoH-like protein
MNILKIIVFVIFISNNVSFKIIKLNKALVSLTKINAKKFKLDDLNNNLYIPKTKNQEKYVNFLNDNRNKIIIVTGPAGTGKTMFACQKAILQLKKEELSKIVITRPVVTVEEDIGFLPGNIIRKMDPWTKPIFDIFQEYYSKTELDMMLNNQKIEICPLAFMRGRTFKNAFIIADEMQNSSPNQMKMLTTRLGDKCRMVITGDLKQTDITKENGLADFTGKINTYKLSNNNLNSTFNEDNNNALIQFIELEAGDIERSEIVKKVIEIYDFKVDNTKIIKKQEINEINIENYKKKDKQFTNLNDNSNINNKTENFNNNARLKIALDKNNKDAALIPYHHKYI